VIAEAIRRSALADYADRFAFLSAASNRGLSVREVPFLTQINLRVNPSETGHMSAIARELGFALSDIRTITTTAGFDRHAALAAHQKWLLEKRARIDRLLRLLNTTMEAEERSILMESSSLFSGFENRQQEEWRNEARERWGTTPAFAESQKRAAAYSASDWAAIQTESLDIERNLAVLMDKDPAAPAVQAQVARHHDQIDSRFYPCSSKMYRALGTLYGEDPRFAEHYNLIRPGLATFLHAAILVYCARKE